MPAGLYFVLIYFFLHFYQAPHLGQHLSIRTLLGPFDDTVTKFDYYFVYCTFNKLRVMIFITDM
jgi:hypothetical protein